MSPMFSICLVVSMAILSGSVEGGSLFNFNHVVKVFRARDCGDWNATIRFNQFQITPHPIIVPGKLLVAVDVDIIRNISDTITADIMMAKRIDLGWFGHYWADITPSCYDRQTCRIDMCNFMSNLVDNHGCPSEIIDNGYTCTCPPISGSYTTMNDVPFVIVIRDEDLPSSMFLRGFLQGSYRLRYSIYDGYGSSVGCIEAEFGLEHRP